MSVPSTKELYESVARDLKNKLNLTDDDLRKTFEAFAGVLSAQLKLLYLRLDDIQENLFPDTATTSENGGELERIGQIYLGRGPNPATAGTFQIQLFGEAGSVVRTGLTFKSNDNSKNPGNLYITDGEYVLTGNNDFVEVRSINGGVDYDLNIGDELTITEPVIGVEQTVEVTSIIEQPKAPEDIEVYRQLILDAIQLEPQGGAKTDYRIWSSDAQGVRKVYPYVKDGAAGVVQIYVEATEEDSTDGNGTPTEQLLNSVENVIEFDPDETKPLNERGRRPIQAIIEVLSVTTIPVDVDITNLEDDSTSVRTSIESNLKEYLRTVRPYIDGADLSRNKNDILYAARLQSVVTDVLQSSNFFTDFSMKVSGVASSSVEFSRADIPYLRNVNYL